MPVSVVGIDASGVRCTLARAMRDASGDRMMAPSILASSDRRCGENSASKRNPPVEMDSTSGPSPTTSSAPRLACSTRSSPSRSGWPGATSASASAMAELGRVTGTAAHGTCGDVHASPVTEHASATASPIERACSTSMPGGPSGHDDGTSA